MTYKEITNKVAEEINLPSDVVDKVYKSYWAYIRNSVKQLPLKESMSEPEFLSLRTNFNVPSLGKLVCTYPRYINIKERFKHIRNIRNSNEETT